jgi:hypothetical protein
MSKIVETPTSEMPKRRLVERSTEIGNPDGIPQKRGKGIEAKQGLR